MYSRHERIKLNWCGFKPRGSAVLLQPSVHASRHWKQIGCRVWGQLPYRYRYPHLSEYELTQISHSSESVTGTSFTSPVVSSGMESLARYWLTTRTSALAFGRFVGLIVFKHYHNRVSFTCDCWHIKTGNIRPVSASLPAWRHGTTVVGMPSISDPLIHS